ncbi:MAG: endopeptidase La [Cellulosilyticaceae bacterium]
MKNKTLHIPLLPIRGLTVFPNMIIHFDVGRDKSLKAIENAMLSGEKIVLVTQKDTHVDEPSAEDLYEVGTLVHIKQIVKLKPPAIKVLVEGEERVRILDVQDEGYMTAEVELIPEPELDESVETEALIRTIGELFESYASLQNKLSMEMVYNILGANSPVEVMDLIIANMPLEVAKKQLILETTSIKERMFYMIEILESEVEVLKIQKQIQSKVQKNIDKTQKEYYLREQLKVIQEELGEKDGVQQEAAQYREKLKDLEGHQEVKEKLEKEIGKLLKTSSHSPESGMLRTYIETLVDVPWGVKTEENIDLAQARDTFEKDHYGLKQVKERIVEYLAVKKMTPQMKAPIICLVGPPGVGKTSIAKSIAEATGRNYVRIALGGVRDEAEIRGHRRTYVGALPGRFVSGMIQSKSMNPVMLLDEVDKMMGDFRGDPAAALLEILDSAQNHTFRDHYLEVPMNLSEVMFVITANTLSTIPRPLLDRMEIIEVESYTATEKLEIAKRYLLPQNISKHGLNKRMCKINDEALRYVIDYYTREAGVRTLERQLGTLCRKVTRELMEENKKSVSISTKKVQDYLGIPKYSIQEKNKEPQIGVVRGLAWTSVGGDTLSIEVNIMEGKGSFELTGNMGNVMKESAKAAMSYIRSRAHELALDPDFYKNVDIHIHIPEGAVPKDGPSAGITMATAIISALTKKPIRADVAMTGEITIRGRVLAIGGLKEKILAAKRAGIYEVIIPKQNTKSVHDISEDVLEKMKVNYVETMDEILDHVFAEV